MPCLPPIPHESTFSAPQCVRCGHTSGSHHVQKGCTTRLGLMHRASAADALRDAWARAGTERVEIACAGGHGRTGTALACLAVLDGIPGREAVGYVREHYAARAVETPGQRRFVSRFS